MSDQTPSDNTETDPNTITLTKPIQAHGKPTPSLTFRRPTGRDLRESGLPFTFTKKKDTRVDTAALSKMMSSLGNVPLGSIDQLSASDYNSCMAIVLGFFTDGPAPTSSTDITNSPDSGEISPEFSA